MPDYELLELILFRAIPRRDVKPLARYLVENFGDFNGVIAVPIDLLVAVNGVGPAVIQELKIVEAATNCLARARILGKPILSSFQALLDYCQSTMAHRETEQLRVLYLDRKNTLIGDELLTKGTVPHVPVYPRERLKSLHSDDKRPILSINHAILISFLITLERHPAVYFCI